MPPGEMFSYRSERNRRPRVRSGSDPTPRLGRCNRLDTGSCCGTPDTCSLAYCTVEGVAEPLLTADSSHCERYKVGIPGLLG